MLDLLILGASLWVVGTGAYLLVGMIAFLLRPPEGRGTGEA